MRQMFSCKVQKPKQLLQQEADIIGFKFCPKEAFCQLWFYLLSTEVHRDNMFDSQMYFFKRIQTKPPSLPKQHGQEAPGCVKGGGACVGFSGCVLLAHLPHPILRPLPVAPGWGWLEELPGLLKRLRLGDDTAFPGLQETKIISHHSACGVWRTWALRGEWRWPLPYIWGSGMSSPVKWELNEEGDSPGVSVVKSGSSANRGTKFFFLIVIFLSTV